MGSFTFDQLFQGLAFARRGPWSWFKGLAEQVNDEPWFALETAQLLSALGHLELVIDHRTLDPKEWAMAPPMLVAIPESGAVLCGWRSPNLLRQIAAASLRLGGQLNVESMPTHPPVVTVTGLRPEDLRHVAKASSSNELGIGVIEDLAIKLSMSLLPLSSLVKALSSFTPPIDQRLELWDMNTNTWKVVDDVIEPGAYRTRSFARRYGFRSQTASGRSLLRGDPRLVKWLAGHENGTSLLSYDPGSRNLICRLGAGLPGLYERAAVMCSGRSPVVDGGFVVYQEVPSEVAGSIWEALRP